MKSNNKQYKISFKVCELEGGGAHILVKTIVNKCKSYLLIDTGASNSIFDINNQIFVDNEYDIEGDVNQASGFNSEIQNIKLGNIENLSIGYFRVKNLQTLFTSLEHVNSLYQKMKLPKILGIIGSDFLIKYNAIINFEEKYILLQKK